MESFSKEKWSLVLLTTERSDEVSLGVAPEFTVTEARPAAIVVRTEAEGERDQRGLPIGDPDITWAAMGSAQLWYKHSHAGRPKSAEAESLGVEADNLV